MSLKLLQVAFTYSVRAHEASTRPLCNPMFTCVQWAFSSVPSSRGPSSRDPASPSYALSGVNALLQEAQGECKDVERQLQEVQASRLQRAQERLPVESLYPPAQLPAAAVPEVEAATSPNSRLCNNGFVCKSILRVCNIYMPEVEKAATRSFRRSYIACLCK